MGGLSKRESNFISNTALFVLKPKIGWLYKTCFEDLKIMGVEANGRVYCFHLWV
jgi:hypothetical protein